MSAGKTNYTYGDIEEISRLLLSKTQLRPALAIICGTGLGGIAQTLQDSTTIEYTDIPNFPVSTVVGHAGRFIIGKISDTPVICMQGRFHGYEGYSMTQITLPVKVMKLMGVEVVIVTNAAGGLNADYSVGDLMILKDHIFMPNLSGQSPLAGANDERFGVRFPPMSSAYDKELRELGRTAAANTGISHLIREGVYAMLGGPSFETIAECRMLRMMGADVVGMSTCPEVVVAIHAGMKVFAMSMVTNKCVVDYDELGQANHEEVLDVGKTRSAQLQQFVKELIKILAKTNLKK